MSIFEKLAGISAQFSNVSNLNKIENFKTCNENKFKPLFLQLQTSYQHFLCKKWKMANNCASLIKKICYTFINMGEYCLVKREYRLMYSWSTVLIILSKMYLLLEKNNEQESDTSEKFFTELYCAMEQLDLTILIGDDIILSPCSQQNDLSFLTNIATIFHDILSTLRPIKPTNLDLEFYNVNTYKKIKQNFSMKDKIVKNICQYFKENNVWTPVVLSCHISPIDFQVNHFMKEIPIVIDGEIDHWDAFHNNRWSIDYFNKKMGYRNVPVEIGSKYTDYNWSQRMMPFYEYVDSYMSKKAKLVGYLAQHCLFDQIPQLMKDFEIPDFCFIGENADNVDINAWIGPKGTTSPAHTDPKNNFLVQIVGRKIVYLFDKSQDEFMYPLLESINKNTSNVDVEEADLKKFPKFSQAKPIIAIIEPGQMLYIPKKCWHYVKSLSTSISINFWFE